MKEFAECRIAAVDGEKTQLECIACPQEVQSAITAAEPAAKRALLIKRCLDVVIDACIASKSSQQ